MFEAFLSSFVRIACSLSLLGAFALGLGVHAAENNPVDLCQHDLNAVTLPFKSKARVQTGPSCSVYGTIPLLESILHEHVSDGYWGLMYAWDRLLLKTVRGGLGVDEIFSKYDFLTVAQLKLSDEFRASFADPSGLSDEQLLDQCAQILVGLEPSGGIHLARSLPMFQAIEKEITRLRNVARINRARSVNIIGRTHAYAVRRSIFSGGPLLDLAFYVPGILQLLNISQRLTGEGLRAGSLNDVFERIRAAIQAGFAVPIGVMWRLIPTSAYAELGLKPEAKMTGNHQLAVVGYISKNGELVYQILDSQHPNAWNATQFRESLLKQILFSAWIYEPLPEHLLESRLNKDLKKRKHGGDFGA